MEDVVCFEKDLVRASQAVSSILGGGQYGHVWIVKDEASFKELTGDDSFVQNEMSNPGLKSDIKSNDGVSTIALKTATLIADNEVYHMQEGVKVGLKGLVIDQIPKVAIQELDDRKFGFT